MRMHFLWIVGMLFAASSAPSTAVGPSPATAANKPFDTARDKPNMVLIVADDLGWGDVGYNDDHIDTLDCFANKEGFVAPKDWVIPEEGITIPQAK